MSDHPRIVDLEVRVAYQDKLIVELDDVLREFSERVERLEAVVKDLKESTNHSPIDGTHERPPHY